MSNPRRLFAQKPSSRFQPRVNEQVALCFGDEKSPDGYIKLHRFPQTAADFFNLASSLYNTEVGQPIFWENKKINLKFKREKDPLSEKWLFLRLDITKKLFAKAYSLGSEESKKCIEIVDALVNEVLEAKQHHETESKILASALPGMFAELQVADNASAQSALPVKGSSK